MIKINILQEPIKDWNSLICSVPEGTIFQTTHWADYMKENSIDEPIYLIAINGNDEIVGLLLLVKTSLIPSRFFGKMRKYILSSYFTYYGPLILDKENEEIILEKFIEKLNRFARKNHSYSFENIFPPIHGVLNHEKITEIYASSKFNATKKSTFLIDLSQDKSILWTNIKKNARKAIRKCENQGVIVERIKDQSELDEYYALLTETRKRMGLSLPPSYPNVVMWKHLRKNNNLEVFMAKQNGQNIAGLGIVLFNGILTEIGSAQSNYSLENKIYANDSIKWEIIKWGCENGHRIYDLGGVSADPQTEKEKGIYQFKSKWGGDLIHFYKYSLIVGRTRNKVIRILKKWMV